MNALDGTNRRSRGVGKPAAVAYKRLQRRRGQRTRRLCIEPSVRFLLGSHDAIHDRGHSLKPPISAGMGQFIRPLTHMKYRS
jgi:hypothetical protein